MNRRLIALVRDVDCSAIERVRSHVNTTELYSFAFALPICPDPWQQQFATDEWPEVLIAPTGSGKTAGVTLGWAAHRLRTPNATPRRLV